MNKNKIKIGTTGSSHEITLELYSAPLDDLIKLVGVELKIILEPNLLSED